MTNSEKPKTAYDHLRDVLRYRLMAWDASSAAEDLLGFEIDSASDNIDSALVGIDRPEEVDNVSDETIAKIFDLDPAG